MNFLFSLTGANLVHIFVNILIFLIAQTTFFHLVMSKLLDQLIVSKVGILNSYMKYDEESKMILSKYLSNDKIMEVSDKAYKQEQLRNNANLNLILKEISPLILIVIVLLFLTIRKMNSIGGEWGKFDTADKWILLILVLSYGTEFLFYNMVFKQYNHIGDFDLLDRIFANVNKYIEKLMLSNKEKELSVISKDNIELTNNRFEISNEFMKILNSF